MQTIINVTLFKYVRINEIFSPDRFIAQSVNLVPFADWNGARGEMIRDIIVNTILFFPFGFLIQMARKKNQNKLSLLAVIIPCASSIAIESLQYIFSLGATDITDVIVNTIAALIGAASYLLFNNIFKKKKKKANEVLLYFIGAIAIFNIWLSI